MCVCVCVCVCVILQSGELAHVGERVIRQGADFIVAQISAKEKGQFQSIHIPKQKNTHTHTHTVLKPANNTYCSLAPWTFVVQHEIHTVKLKYVKTLQIIEVELSLSHEHVYVCS